VRTIAAVGTTFEYPSSSDRRMDDDSYGFGPAIVQGRVGIWHGGNRSSVSVPAPVVRRCLSSSTVAPFPHPSHRTGHEDLLCPEMRRLVR